MDHSTISVIEKAIERYPFYQSLYLLLLQNMYAVHDSRFSKQLSASALCVADRSVLFDMVEGMNFSIPTAQIESSNDGEGGDKTFALIDNFLKGVPTQVAPQQQPTDGADPMIDYSLYLEQLPDIGHDENHVPAKNDISHTQSVSPQQDIEQKTLDAASVSVADVDVTPQNDTPVYEEDEEFTVPFITNHLADTPSEEPAQTDDTVFEQEHKKEFYTETMASLYIKQQKYEQALEIIESISAENPKKSAYFADQMRYLKLLIRINKNKSNRNV